MSIATIPAGARSFLVNADTANRPGAPLIELGVAGTNALTSTLIVQFTLDSQFVGEFAVLARTMGTAADARDVPFVPVPYRVGNLNNSAVLTNGLGWPWSVATITSSALIQIPANGLSIVLLSSCTAGSCQITTWDVSGGSAM